MQNISSQPKKLSKKQLLALLNAEAEKRDAAYQSGQQPNLSLGKVRPQWQYPS